MLVLGLIIFNLKFSADSTALSTSVDEIKTELKFIKSKSSGCGADNIKSEIFSCFYCSVYFC